MSCQCKTDRHRAKCMWWIDKSDGIIETNPATGEIRFLTGCFPEVFFKLMEFVIHTNVSAASAVESHRNVVDNGFKQLTSLVALASANNHEGHFEDIQNEISLNDQKHLLEHPSSHE